MKKIIALSLALSLGAFSAHAQTANGRYKSATQTLTDGSVAPLALDVNENLNVNCKAGCAGGSFNNSGAAVAPSAANGQAASWLYAFDASNWQYVGITGHRLQVEATISGTATFTVNQGTSPWVVNTTQLGGNAIDVGSGNIGSATQRIVEATNAPANALKGQGATAAAAPANAVQAGARSGANMVGLIQADASKAISVASNTILELVALSGSTKIYVTSFDFISAGTANVKLVYGTGTNCGTGTTDLTGLYPLTAQAGIAKGNGLGPVLVVPAGNALCISDSASVQISGSVSYTQF